MDMKNLPTHERVTQLLTYNQDTGDFVRKVTVRGTNGRAGTVAGCYSSIGYRLIKIDQKIIFAHRLAWFYMFEKWPEFHIDHINGIKDDNRISNLREATNVENMRNAPAPITNKSGIKGVHWHKKTRRWRAQIRVNVKIINVGSFLTRDEAAKAVSIAREKLHGEFAHHG